MCETLREPVKVLKSLSEKTTNKEYKFKRLYRNLYNPEFYFLAYKNISQSQGSMTPGVDGKSLDGMSEKRINALIESLKDFSYQPNPARRVYIEKKNSTKKRPLGIPSTEDKLVQEVVKMILESIYEPRNGIFMVPYNTKKGLKYCEFYHDGFKKKRYACSFEPDLLPQYVKYDNPNYLRTRIKLGVCELCGENTGDICMHHVKSLKSIKADNEWNTIMLTKRRKTLAVCPNCYAMITK